jgi:hypothetical protein
MNAGDEQISPVGMQSSEGPHCLHELVLGETKVMIARILET